MGSAKLIQFGDNWVKVRDNVYYLSKHEVEVLEIWYSFSVKHDEEMSEEERADEIEFFAKALKLLDPENSSEASRYITWLEYLYEDAPNMIKEIIDRIYNNLTRITVEDEVEDEM